MAEKTTLSNPPEIESLTAERRVRVRYAQPLRTYIQRGQGDLDQVWWMGKIRDISSQGIALLLQQRFEPDSFLTVEVENRAQTSALAIQVRVVRTTPQPGCWLIGCTFSRELSEEELQALLASQG
jgi:PilZ domain